jgi:hypothetical protein
VIANHVLEHIPDEDAAFAELKRVVSPYGTCILSVPQIFAWGKTHEDDSIVDPHARRLHFGQSDHRRLYGRDFEDKLRRAGFCVAPFQMDRTREIQFSLSRGETLYIAQPDLERGDRDENDVIAAFGAQNNGDAYSAAALADCSDNMRRQ